MTCTLHLIGISIVYKFTCINPEVFCINKEKEICLPNKKCLSGVRCERENMAPKYSIFLNCIKNIVGIGKKKNECQTRNT